MPGQLAEIFAEVRQRFDTEIGIHPHNDSDVGVANAIVAVQQGATHVQGCMNGYGERCGNASLSSIIANLELKLGHTTIGPAKLASLASVAHFIAELANLPIGNGQPYVGRSAFAHKGGIHVAAVIRDAATYEHIRPELVGGNILYKLKEHGLEDRLPGEARRELLERIKHLEFQGYELEAAEGTFELLVREALHPGIKPFELVSFDVSTKMTASRGSESVATVTLKAKDGVHSATATGHGPVNALDLCLRQCLASLYPAVKDVRLVDYKVRVLDTKKGTAAKVRVLVEWTDHKKSWTTVGVSENVIEASWFALADAIRLELMRLIEKDDTIEKAV